MQGITHPEGYRTLPSAGALYPLETYVVIVSGFYHYDPRRHQLRRLSEKDMRRALYCAALEQESVLDAPAVFVIAAVYERTAGKYGPSRARRYVDLEAGHAAQNLLLQAVALDLGGVPLGAFEDAEVQKALSQPADHRPSLPDSRGPRALKRGASASSSPCGQARGVSWLCPPRVSGD